MLQKADVAEVIPAARPEIQDAQDRRVVEPLHELDLTQEAASLAPMPHRGRDLIWAAGAAPSQLSYFRRRRCNCFHPPELCGARSHGMMRHSQCAL